MGTITTQWLKDGEFPHHTIGGSDAPKVNGTARFNDDLVTLWNNHKLGREPMEPNGHIDRGHYMEPCIIDMMAHPTESQNHTPVMVAANRNEDGLQAAYFNDTYPWAHFRPDGLGDGFVVEIKAHSMPVIPTIKKRGAPLDDAWTQIQHGLAVMDLPFGIFVTLDYDEFKLVMYEVKRDQEYIDKLMDSERRVWEALERGDKYPPNLVDIFPDVVAIPSEEPVVVEVPGDHAKAYELASTVQAYRKVKNDAAKKDKVLSADLKQELKNYPEATLLYCGGMKLVRKITTGTDGEVKVKETLSENKGKK